MQDGTANLVKNGRKRKKASPNGYNFGFEQKFVQIASV
jgi:hypothetical protein